MTSAYDVYEQGPHMSRGSCWAPGLRRLGKPKSVGPLTSMSSHTHKPNNMKGERFIFSDLAARSQRPSFEHFDSTSRKANARPLAPASLTACPVLDRCRTERAYCLDSKISLAIRSQSCWPCFVIRLPPFLPSGIFSSTPICSQKRSSGTPIHVSHPSPASQAL